MGPLDTDEEADSVQREAWRRMGPDRRVETALEMSDEVRRITLDGLHERHPGAEERDLIAMLIEMWHGPEIAAAIVGTRDPA